MEWRKTGNESREEGGEERRVEAEGLGLGF